MLLVTPIVLLAQTEGSSPGLDFLGVYVANFAAFVGAIIVVTSLVNKLFKIAGNAKQYLSWIIAVIIGYAAFFLKLGIFAGVAWYIVLVYVALFALGSNGLFDWELIRGILKALKLESTVPEKT